MNILRKCKARHMFSRGLAVFERSVKPRAGNKNKSPLELPLGTANLLKRVLIIRLITQSTNQVSLPVIPVSE